MKQSRSKLFIRIVDIVFITIIIAIIFQMAIKERAYEESRELNQMLRKDMQRQENQVPDEDWEPDYVNVVQKKSNLKSIKDLNSDAVGWIHVRDTNIDYPVMQGQDNLYYLQNSFEKKKSIVGSIYMDYRNNGLFTDQNTIIYGHEMNDGSMFYDLRYMKRQDYAKQNKEILITLDDKLLEYEIFSVYLVEADYDYRTPNYKNLNEFQAFLNRISEKSIVEMGIMPDIKDKILTLSTCSKDFKDARLVVHARLKTKTIQ